MWKKFKEESRPQFSFFRYGLDLIREIIFKPLKQNGFKVCLRHIYPLPPDHLEGFL
jgi:hypothetical protein